MDLYTESLFMEIINFCKAASQSLGQSANQPLKLSELDTNLASPSSDSLSDNGPQLFDKEDSDSEITPTLNHHEYSSVISSTSSPKTNWTEKEDQILLEVITNYKKNWDKIKARVYKLTKMRKTVGFLRKRYSDMVSSSKDRKNSKYSHSEDLRIVKGILDHGYDWIKIANDFPDRDSRSIKNRFYYHISKKNLMDTLVNEVSEEEGKKLN